MTGRIKNINLKKRFGFLKSDDTGKDYFFHSSEMFDESQFEDLWDGLSVEFEPVDSPKGPRAIIMKVVG